MVFRDSLENSANRGVLQLPRPGRAAQKTRQRWPDLSTEGKKRRNRSQARYTDDTSPMLFSRCRKHGKSVILKKRESDHSPQRMKYSCRMSLLFRSLQCCPRGRCDSEEEALSSREYSPVQDCSGAWPLLSRSGFADARKRKAAHVISRRGKIPE